MELQTINLNEENVNDELLFMIRNLLNSGMELKLVCKSKNVKIGPPSREKLEAISERKKTIMDTQEWEDIVNDL